MTLVTLTPEENAALSHIWAKVWEQVASKDNEPDENSPINRMNRFLHTVFNWRESSWDSEYAEKCYKKLLTTDEGY